MASHWLALVLTALLVVASLMMLWRHQPRGAGPLLLTLFAAPLVLLNPIINLAFDLKSIDESKAMSAMLNVVTWLGVIQMTAGSFWNSSMDKRVFRWWQKRRGNTGGGEVGGASAAAAGSVAELEVG